MKKRELLMIVLILVIITGCGLTKLSNTPIKQVELFLNKYQTLDEDVLNDLNAVVMTEDKFNGTQKEKYKKIMKNHYQNLIYKIKEEEINGDTAIVTVEIDVTDYSRITNEDKLDMDKYLNMLENSKDKVKYTLELGLTKIDDKWQINQISKSDEEKIHGAYIY